MTLDDLLLRFNRYWPVPRAWLGLLLGVCSLTAAPALRAGDDDDGEGEGAQEISPDEQQQRDGEGAQGISPDEQQQRDAARRAYSQGTDAYRKGNFAGAYDDFKAANDLIPTPHAQYWMAQCADVLGMSDLARSAYAQFLNNPELSKAGEQKISHAHERFTELMQELEAEQHAYAPPSQDEPASSEAATSGRTHQPADPSLSAPDTEDPYQSGPSASGPASGLATPEDLGAAPASDDFFQQYKPIPMLWELGAFGGLMAVSSSHDLRESGRQHHDYQIPAAAFGVRAAFFPSPYLGLELEYTRGQGEVRDPDGPDDSAVFNTFNAQVIGQLASSRVVPFGMLGAGAINGISDSMGSDTDPLFVAGLGVKMAIIDLLTARIDLRADLSEGRDSDMTVSGKALVGLSATLGR